MSKYKFIWAQSTGANSKTQHKEQFITLIFVNETFEDILRSEFRTLSESVLHRPCLRGRDWNPSSMLCKLHPSSSRDADSSGAFTCSKGRKKPTKTRQEALFAACPRHRRRQPPPPLPSLPLPISFHLLPAPASWASSRRVGPGGIESEMMPLTHRRPDTDGITHQPVVFLPLDSTSLFLRSPRSDLLCSVWACFQSVIYWTREDSH